MNEVHLSPDLFPRATLGDYLEALFRPRVAQSLAEQRAKVRRALSLRLSGRVDYAANPKLEVARER